SRPLLAASQAAGAAVGAMGAESRAARERVVHAQMEEWTLARYAAGRVGIDDSGWLTGMTPTLGRAGAVAISFIEVLVAALCGWMIAGRAASEPACADCGRWRLARALPEARQGIARPLVDRLLAGEDVRDLVARPDTRERTLLALHACPDHDAGGGVLRVSELRWTRRRRVLAARHIEDLEVDAATVGAIEERLRG
ncbi:MAG TPA: hypothetical protein VMZ28_19330, partial [Kofleriaceae bacterium]|nr:hypothetical protein [Kofleriaceae bacterium]